MKEAEDRTARGRDFRAAMEEESMSGTGPDLATMSASDLLATEFPEPGWAVPGLIPEGFLLIAGRPKIGKSFLALLLAACKAAAFQFLGRTPAERGGVLYVALEDSPRRIKKRLLMMGIDQAPESLYFLFKLPKIGSGGLEALDQWLAKHPDVRLVVIDVYAKIRDSKPKNGDSYQHDADQAGQLHELASRRGVSLVVVHHDRKAGADDWLETISGTFGLTGTADAVALLERDRGSANGRLRITGRDIEDQDLSLLFEAGKWTAIGDGEEFKLSPERQAILAFLREKGPQGPGVISLGTSLKPETVKRALREMKGQFVYRNQRGIWRAL